MREKSAGFCRQGEGQVERGREKTGLCEKQDCSVTSARVISVMAAIIQAWVGGN